MLKVNRHPPRPNLGSTRGEGGWVWALMVARGAETACSGRKNSSIPWWGILSDAPPVPIGHISLYACTFGAKEPEIVQDVDRQYDQANYAYSNQGRYDPTSHCGSAYYPEDNGSQRDHKRYRDDRKCQAHTKSPAA